MDENRIDFIEGQLMATQAAIRSLILGSPDPKAAARRVAAEIEKLSAIGLNSANSDEFVRGLGWARDCLLPSKRDFEEESVRRRK